MTTTTTNALTTADYLAKQRPTHVHGNVHGDRFTVSVASVAEWADYPVRYDDSDDRRAYTPKVGVTYAFEDGHVVAPTMPYGVGGRKTKEHKTYSFYLPPDIDAQISMRSEAAGISKSAWVQRALTLQLLRD